ncbi:unnamed protein product [Brassica rapa subsp. narinosa]
MAIGKELGPILDKDVDRGRIRVLIDGLEKLEMRLPIELPSGDIIKVNLEYEKLEKHCFLCYSLRHEKDSCPLNRDNTSIDLRNQGISQQNTLRKLDESRRRHDSRRSGTRSSKDREADSRDQQRFSQRSIQSRLQEPERRHYASQDKSRSFYSREEERRYSGEHRNGREGVQVRDHSSHHSFPAQRNHSPVRRVSPSHRSQGERRAQNSIQRTQSSRTPPPRPAREAMDVPAIPDHNEVNSRTRERIPAKAYDRIEWGFLKETLTGILRRYEKSSGQCINLSKSTVTFSSRTPGDIKDRVKRALGIEQEGGMGKYLGLPETFGRRKRDVFTGLVDKIRQRSQSWTTRFLSGAGKHVMLQSVLTSLPTHSMSSFKIPISLCNRIQSILTRFWWDSAPDKRKIAWVAWSTMARPKFLGGLGFKNLEDYNDSLLAKLSWRIHSKPNSLLAQVLKGKYFPDCSFLESKEISGSSHGWTSILAGLKVLHKGVGFVVGNGHDISVWSDNWLSTSKPMAPIGPPTFSNQHLMVQDLLEPGTNEWDLQKIRQHLPHYEESIRLLITSVSAPSDRVVWLPESSGEYTTKSGYKRIFEENNDLNPDFDWMKLVWKLHIPPKIQHFLWRLLNDALPVGELLAIRGINTDLHCKRCGEAESLHHLFLQCPFAVELWHQAPVSPQIPDSLSIENLKVWLKRTVFSQVLPPVGLSSSPVIPWLLWNVWTARNKVVFEGKVFQVTEVISKSIADAREWEAANLLKDLKQTKKTGPLLRLHSVPMCWTDGAWQENSKSGGMGWIIKNAEGEVLMRGSSNRAFVCSALMAEALAIRDALIKAKELNLLSIQLFSDSQVLVSALRSGLDVIEIAGVLLDIRNLATLFCPLSFIFIPRLENRQADSLARAALERLIAV